MILSNDKRNAALRLDEKTHVEEPFLQQLEDLGWTVIRLKQQLVALQPAAGGGARGKRRAVLLQPVPGNDVPTAGEVWHDYYTY